MNSQVKMPAQMQATESRRKAYKNTGKDTEVSVTA